MATVVPASDRGSGTLCAFAVVDASDVPQIDRICPGADKICQDTRAYLCRQMCAAHSTA